MSFKIEMLVSQKVKDAWGSEADLKYTRLRYEVTINRGKTEYGIEELYVSHESLEKLNHNDDKWVKIIPKQYLNLWRPRVATGKRGIPYMETIEENGIPTVLVPQDGTTGNKRRFPLNNATRTVLSSFDTIDFPHVFAVKEEMKSWKFLQLNPEDLRKPTSKKLGSDIITQSGLYLAAALHRIKLSDAYALREISRKLQTFLPNFIDVDVVDDVENRQYIIKLTDVDGKKYSSRVLSEGTLRILTLCILEHDHSHTGLLCFEEPENGVHPFRIGTMAQLLRDLSVNFQDENSPLRQVIVNTHSPVLLREITSWVNNDYTGLWYANIRKRIMDYKGNRVAIAITNVVPIDTNENFQLSIFSTQDTSLAVSSVEKYLNFAPSN
jgi:predicted ATP-dependent endonuclease of OLD family